MKNTTQNHYTVIMVSIWTASALLFSGCANIIPVSNWAHDTKSQEQLEIDGEDCTIRANQLVGGSGVKGEIGLNYLIMEQHKQHYERCMKRKGWTPAE